MITITKGQFKPPALWKLNYSPHAKSSHLLSNGVSKVVLKGDDLILVDNFQKELKLSCDFMVTWKKLLLSEVQSRETNKAV